MGSLTNCKVKCTVRLPTVKIDSEANEVPSFGQFSFLRASPLPRAEDLKDLNVHKPCYLPAFIKQGHKQSPSLPRIRQSTPKMFEKPLSIQAQPLGEFNRKPEAPALSSGAVVRRSGSFSPFKKNSCIVNKSLASLQAYTSYRLRTRALNTLLGENIPLV